MINTKNTGFALISTVILGSIVLTMVLAASVLVAREFSFLRDFLQGERVYFSAESGVEEALRLLKENPINHIENHENSNLLTGATMTIDIDNLADTIKFSLRPLKTKQWRFAYDKKSNDTVEEFRAGSMRIEAKVGLGIPNFHWKFSCTGENSEDSSDTQTFVLEKSSNSTTITNITAENGRYLDQLSAGSEEVKTANFNSWNSVSRRKIQDDGTAEYVTYSIQKDDCFFSLQNIMDLSDASSLPEILFIITPNLNAKISLPEATVTAIGKARKKQKIVQFKHSQLGLPSVFDFVFIHQD